MFRLTMMPFRTIFPLLLLLSIFLSLLLLVSCFQTARASSSEDADRDLVRRSAPDDCRSVSDVFAGHAFDEDPVVPTTKVNGQNLEICNETTAGTCCTKSLEETLITLAVYNMQDAVTNFSSDLKSHLVSDAKLFRDNFDELLSLSENNTRDVLTSTFKIPVANANAIVEKLFSDFAAYIQIQDQVNVRQSINQFFDSIFPLVFTFSLDTPNAALTDEYQECLKNSRKDLRPPPFGEAAGKLVQDVARSLEVARALLDAFDLMAEAINITNRLGNEQYCSRATARLLFCSRCEGHTEVQPCRSLCLNVMRGCMAHVAEVNNHWNLFVSAVEKLLTSMRGTHDFQDVLNLFHSRVYESVMHYLDNSPKYHLKVISRCGPPIPGVTTAEISTADGEVDSSSAAATTEAGRPMLEEFPTKMHKKFAFTTIVRNIGSSKGFFNKLPDVVCDSEQFSSASHNSSCWNGTAISRYSRNVPASALTSQVAENPEVQVPDALVPGVVKLIEKLNTMTKLLHKRVIPRPFDMLSNGYGFYGSGGSDTEGSVSWDHSSTDDAYSGSGSGISSGNFSEGPFTDLGILVTSTDTDKVSTRVETVDTTDFVFVPKSTASSLQPSPYRTSSPEPPSTKSTSTTPTTTTTAATVRIATNPPVKGQSSVRSAVTFLLLLAITIQRILCA